MKEACGVFAVYAPGYAAAQLTFDGLYSLQHRGQESAGMAVSDGSLITVVKDMGLVSSVFDERTIECLPGAIAIGHTRYSTAGDSTWRNAQPVFRSIGNTSLALAHNGNLINVADLAVESGMIPEVLTTDSDFVAELLSTAVVREMVAREASGQVDGSSGTVAGASGLLEAAMIEVLPRLHGAYSFVAMDSKRIFAARDPDGFRPLCLGALPGNDSTAGGSTGAMGASNKQEQGGQGYVIASETPALDVVGAKFLREIEPGEMVAIDASGVHSLRLSPAGARDPHLCIFEFVYFARPDSNLYGTEVHGARRRMGECLAGELPVNADMVMGVPDSGVPAAEGYSRASGIPYGQGLVKNRYIGRTFITPGQKDRAAGVRRKLNPLKESISGKRLVVVDDSIVRGTTTRAMVKMLREAGAKEVHLRISSPPFRWPCFFGIDTPERSELLAASRTVSEIIEYLGADSLAYLSLKGLYKAIGVPGGGFCTACLTGDYPVPVREEMLQMVAASAEGARTTAADAEEEILQPTIASMRTKVS
ncbi:MAG: amidophosphoribosyltransferase [Acidimicrobiales bacterium]